MATCEICGNKIGIGRFTYRFKTGQKIDGNCRMRLKLPDTVLRYKNDFEFCKRKVLAQLDSESKAIDFEPTTIFSERISVNDDDNSFVVTPVKITLTKTHSAFFKYEDLKSFDVIEDGNTVKGGLARAAVGGVTFGGAGAVVGAVTGKTKKTISEYKIKLNLNNRDQPFYVLNLLDMEIKKSNPIFSQLENTMNETIAGLQYILDQNETAKVSTESSLDELPKLKELLDLGILTQEEFDAKKKQILSL